MKIVDQMVTPIARKITLNDIPVGTVFSGTIETRHVAPEYGIFLKAWGPVKCQHCDEHDDVLVVRLDCAPVKGGANCWPTCREVSDYTPLDTELIIKGRL